MGNLWQRMVLAGLVSVLAACGNGGGSEELQEAGPEFVARPADAPRAVSAQPPDFLFTRYRVDVEGDAPRICLGFTEPLDPDADYSPYVALEDSEAVAFSVSGQFLCMGGMGFGESQQVTLRSGLPSAAGSALESDETIEIEFGDRPAYVGLAGDGVILPRRDADGLAVETVNVETVHLNLWRINDRALVFRNITQGYSAGEGEYYWLDSDQRPFDVAEEIWSGEMDTAGPANTAVTTVFPIAQAIGTLEPGAYFVQVRDAAEAVEGYRQPARAGRWLIITDLAFTAYRGDDGLDFTVRSLQTAQPMSDIRVQLVAASNEVLEEVATSEDGLGRFSAPLLAGTGGMRPRMLMAYGPDNDFALLDLNRSPVDLSSENVGGRQRPEGGDGYFYLDRDIFRPGETVQMSLMLRDSEGFAITDRAGSVSVYGPNGIEAARYRFNAALNAGTVHWDFPVSRTAARGQWRMVAELDGYGSVASTRYTVEDFVPQRIEVELDVDTQAPINLGEVREIRSDVRFLYGAPGAGLTVEGRFRVQRDPSPFDDYAGFSFGRHDEEFREIARELPDTIADGAGRANLMLDIGDIGRDSSLPLRVRAVVSAIEPGGRAVSDDVRVPYRPRPVYLGLERERFESEQRERGAAFDIVAVDALGQSRPLEVTWRLVRIDWHYDWYRANGGRWTWRRTRQVVPIQDGILRLDGQQLGQLRFEEMDWGSYELYVEDAEFGAQASMRFWAGYGGRGVADGDAPDRVQVAGPEENVAIGDEAIVTVIPPFAGEAQLVVATDRVIETRTVSLPEEGAEIRFDVTEAWGSGAYVMVSVFTPRDPVDEPRPRRAVGVGYLPVDMAARTLDFTLDVPDRILPRQTLTIPVEMSGPVEEGAYISVAAVDEGILALTRFASPDPHGWYFSKSALGVQLHDDYDRLLDPNQGAAAAIRSGGDQIGGAGLSVVPTQSVALFSGPVQVDEDGTAMVVLDIPDFNGQLRLMAVAWSQTGLGQLARPLIVRDDVPAEIIFPRFLAPGDQANATLTIDNVDGAAGRYTARITGTGAVSVDETLAARYNADQRRESPVALAGTGSGLAEVTLDVSGPDGFAVERSYPIEVRSGFLPLSVIERARLEPGAEWTPAPDVLASFVSGSESLTVSFAATPLDHTALLESLLRYPYGCSEQITSRAMPLLYAGQMAGLENQSFDPRHREIIQDAVETLLNRQSADGTFGLWRVGDRYASPWLGAYITDFLARAKDAGFAVPDAALDQALDAMVFVGEQEFWRVRGYASTVTRWSGSTDTDQRLHDRAASYALYVLAREGRADRSRLRYMHDERLGRIDSPLARAHIATALALIGDRARSRNALGAAENRLGYNNRGDWYQTPRRDRAGVMALAVEAGDFERVDRLIDDLVADLPDPNRMTTQEKAFLLLAARALMGEGETISLEVEGNVAASEANLHGAVYDVAPSVLAEGVQFANAGQTSLWVTQVAHGEPASPPGASAEGVVVAKQVLNMDGSAANLDRVTQSDRLIIEVVIDPQERRTIPAIMVDMLPAGFEIEAAVEPHEARRTGVYSFLGEVDRARTTQIRDDRFVAAIHLRNGEPVRLAYIVRAVTPGEFALPGAVVEDMYAPDTFGRSASDTVLIRAGN